ncbi:MAG: ATP-dependent sacrificial sulfur transferase LarE [Actinobacteria bacterium]|nr:ATP-dependent sacrificial sulfur transferase LarE [Actinomycetota bacterium]
MNSREDTSAEQARMERLRQILQESAPLLVAFSGGVDSAFLLKTALDAVGPAAVVAVTAHGDVHTAEELEAARSAAAQLGARHLIIRTEELSIPGFADNPPERCYLCRKEMYAMFIEVARAEGMATVVDGANRDDQMDYRPGLRAAAALGVRSPLAEVGYGKEEIRRAARDLGLSSWNLPASACLASRFPYGETITLPKLHAVAEGERFLRSLGFSVVRLRHHGEVARIEVTEADMSLALGDSVRRAIVEHLRASGYVYVTLDLEGFRSGSLNAVLPRPEGEEQA